MVSAIKRPPEFTKFKDMIAFKAGNGSIWKKVRKALLLNAEDVGVQTGRRNCQARWKRIFWQRCSGCVRKTLT